MNNNAFIKNNREIVGFKKIMDFTGYIYRRERFTMKDYIKVNILEFFLKTIVNAEKKTVLLNNQFFLPLFNVFYKQILNKKINAKDLNFYNSWNSNISYLSQRFKWWMFEQQFKDHDKDEAINALTFYTTYSYFFNYLRRFWYYNYKERNNPENTIELNPKFKYNDYYYLFFKLRKLRKWKRKLLITNLRKKVKLNIIKNFFCIEGIIGLEKATLSYLVKSNRTTLLKIAYALHKKYRIPLKYKKFKKLTFKLTKLNQFRFNITKRPEYTLWYNKMLAQASGKKEYVLNSLINVQ